MARQCCRLYIAINLRKGESSKETYMVETAASVLFKLFNNNNTERCHIMDPHPQRVRRALFCNDKQSMSPENKKNI